MHMHHDKERSRGGDESMGNLVAACAPCHKRFHKARDTRWSSKES
jgi:5-methylcytosine-specific restriction endonuclease McrA